MTDDSDTGGKEQRRDHVSLLVPSLQVGAAAGTVGVITGGVVGVLRNTTPVLFATVSGAQWFGLGSVFWFSRTAILRHHYEDSATSKQRLLASSAAGGLAGGSIAALMRGRRNIVPGIVVLSLLGFCGQSAFNAMDASQEDYSHAKAERKPLMARFAGARWSPMVHLSDKEYEDMLQEKLLRIDAEIALLDDRIEELRKSDIEKDPR